MGKVLPSLYFSLIGGSGFPRSCGAWWEKYFCETCYTYCLLLIVLNSSEMLPFSRRGVGGYRQILLLFLDEDVWKFEYFGIYCDARDLWKWGLKRLLHLLHLTRWFWENLSTLISTYAICQLSYEQVAMFSIRSQGSNYQKRKLRKVCTITRLTTCLLIYAKRFSFSL